MPFLFTTFNSKTFSRLPLLTRHLTSASKPSPLVTVISQANSASPYTQSIQARRHILVGDEPTPIGADLGPDPYDYILSALGSCTNITLQMYANRKSWSLENITTKLSHSKIHLKDCETCVENDSRAGRNGTIDHIVRSIEINAPQLDTEKAKRLKAIADMCPVHQTLSKGVIIDTKLQLNSGEII